MGLKQNLMYTIKPIKLSLFLTEERVSGYLWAKQNIEVSQDWFTTAYIRSLTDPEMVHNVKTSDEIITVSCLCIITSRNITEQELKWRNGEHGNK